MNLDFDFTTEDGKRFLLRNFDRWGWNISPGAWLLKKTYDFTSSLHDDAIKEQREAVIEVIKAGKENDVDSMTITMDHNIGVDFEGKIEGVPVKAKIGKNGKVIMEVKFK